MAESWSFMSIGTSQASSGRGGARHTLRTTPARSWSTIHVPQWRQTSINSRARNNLITSTKLLYRRLHHNPIKSISANVSYIVFHYMSSQRAVETYIATISIVLELTTNPPFTLPSNSNRTNNSSVMYYQSPGYLKFQCQTNANLRNVFNLCRVHI